MGLFDTARSAMNGNRAYRLHVDANKLANDGRIDEARAKYREALKLYESSVQAGNNAPNILTAYSLLLMREGEFDRARDVMHDIARQKNLSKDDWFELRLQYAIYLWRTGQLDRAFETAGRAADYRMNGAVYSTLGMFWADRARQTGDVQEALKFNLEALDYDDEDAATLDNLAQIYEYMSETADTPEAAREYRRKALDHYWKAHRAKPRQITTIYYLARMLHQDGDDARARELLSGRGTLYVSALCPVTREMLDALAAEVGERR